MFRFLQPHTLIAATMAFAGIMFAPGIQAEAPSPSSGVLWIDWAAEQVAFALQEAAPADLAPAQPVPNPLPATHSIETVEINRLREDIRLLRDMIEQGVIGRVISLENEVRMLRSALEQQQVVAYGNPAAVPQPGMSVPMPAEFAAINPVPPQPAPLPEAPPEPFSFTVVDEWGRSPEVVAELGNNASTLIGMAGVVPPRSTKTDVVALTQELHEEYAAYDNINIEIFDTQAAAQDFATRQIVDSAHHIASISRYKASGRDLILYIANGNAEPVPLAAK